MIGGLAIGGDALDVDLFKSEGAGFGGDQFSGAREAGRAVDAVMLRQFGDDVAGDAAIDFGGQRSHVRVGQERRLGERFAGLRGARRRRGVDRGFVMSDHADWPGLLSAIRATEASQVIVTHGSIPVMVRWLRQIGLDAKAFETEYGDDEATNVASSDDETSAAPEEGEKHAAPNAASNAANEAAQEADDA